MLLACFRYCFLKINENEKQFGIMAAPFFIVEHTVHVHMTRCKSLLAQTTTTNNSITKTTNTKRAKFLKHSPPPFVSGRSPLIFPLKHCFQDDPMPYFFLEYFPQRSPALRIFSSICIVFAFICSSNP